MGPRTKAQDEVFCRSCGEAIKAKAEICPHCGVRNVAQSRSAGSQTTARRGAHRSSSGTGTSSHSSSTNASTAGDGGTAATPSRGRSVAHDPSLYETTVSESWYYAVGAGVAGWGATMLLSPLTDGTLGALLGFLMLAAWVAVPVGVYFDAKYVRANSPWNPTSAAYIAGGLFPVVGALAGAVYLYRRHEVLGNP